MLLDLSTLRAFMDMKLVSFPARFFTNASAALQRQLYPRTDLAEYRIMITAFMCTVASLLVST